jgi:hypothetical protein
MVHLIFHRLACTIRAVNASFACAGAEEGKCRGIDAERLIVANMAVRTECGSGDDVDGTTHQTGTSG